MPINPNLLVSAAMLQDYIVDKDTGKPLANGIVTMWVDNARYTQYKNWYYQTGVPGAYTYIPLDNPLHLSSVGTIQDPQGNDVIPFYYPFDENNENIPQTYFVTVYSSDQNGEISHLQFTRENFPFQPSQEAPTGLNPTFRNYILNNVYWRNCGNVSLTNETNFIVAPSQHEGYTNGDIRFLKDVTGANDALSFLPMTQLLDNDITPEFYLNFNCSGAQAGETVKCIQYPVSLHVATLQNVDFSLVIQAQNVSGNVNNYLDVYVYQYTGTGALTASNLILLERIVLGNEFQKFIIQKPFPDAELLNLGNGGDDALFIRIQYPLATTFEINHTKPQLYLSENVPDNDFDTYDQIETIINSPRTGDFRTSLNTFAPFGWVACNDGVLSYKTGMTTPTPPMGIPIARANQDTWPLYNIIWNVNASLAPIYDSAGVLTSRGMTAIADFSAFKQLSLTKVLGRVLIGAPLSSTFTYDHTTSLLTVADTSLYYVGSTVSLSNTGGALPAAFTAGTIYYVIPVSATTFKLATTYANALLGTSAAAGADDGTGTQTISFALGGYFGEDQHTQLESELATHHHPGSTVAAGVGAGNSGFAEAAATGATHVVTVAPDGNSAPFNIVQPSSYCNVFLKL